MMMKSLRPLTVVSQLFLNPNSKASIAYRNIARRILGESIPLQTFRTGTQRGFLKNKEIFWCEVNKAGTHCLRFFEFSF